MKIPKMSYIVFGYVFLARKFLIPILRNIYIISLFTFKKTGVLSDTVKRKCVFFA